MLILLLFVISLVILDVAAVRWGHDSREPLDSPEYDRLRAWRGFGN